MKRKIKLHAIIFDMDGVITNTMPEHYRSWRTVLAKIGVRVSHHDVYSREGQPGMNSVQELFAQYGRAISNQQAHKILREKESYFKKIVRTRFIPGARTFLKKLQKNKFRLALVTGTSRHEMNQILPVSIRKLFSLIVTGNDVHHGKPHPEPYLKTLQKLNLQPSDAVVIENAPFGIQSAKEAGLVCLALETSLPRQYLHRADAVFTSIKELQKHVLFSNANGKSLV